MLSWLRLVTAGQEQLLWGVADYLAKVVFSSHLWQKNFVTIEDRKVRDGGGGLQGGLMYASRKHSLSCLGWGGYTLLLSF